MAYQNLFEALQNVCGFVALESDMFQIIDAYEKDVADIQRSNKIELLDRYTRFLQKQGYIDTDATCEEPFAIDEFLRNEFAAKKDE